MRTISEGAFMDKQSDVVQPGYATLVAGHTTVRDAAHIASQQVSAAVESVTQASRDVANVAGERASSVTTALEDFGRRNPLRAMATALAVGVAFGFLCRRSGP
jgi:ElaB/YqjD/DUF883 family membrane-anchored ribosome-binding protein